MAAKKKEEINLTDNMQVVNEDTEKKVRIRSKLTSYNRWGYAFVVPFVVVFCVFSIYPVLRTLYLSFTQYKGFGTPKWLGLDNYIRVLTDKIFWQSFGNTWKIWGINIVLQLGLAFLLTIIFSDIKYKVKGLSIFRAVFYLPNIIAATSVALLFQALMDKNYGSFNKIIYDASIKLNKTFSFIPRYKMVDWLGDKNTAFLIIAIVAAWMWFGNSFIMLMASVQGIPTDYFEAAAIDGANRWKVFGKITLPLIKPILLYVAITSLIGGLQMFDLPYLMVRPGNQAYSSIRTAMMYLYSFGFGNNRQMGYASAVAYILFLIIFAFSVAQFFLFNRKEDK